MDLLDNIREVDRPRCLKERMVQDQNSSKTDAGGGRYLACVVLEELLGGCITTRKHSEYKKEFQGKYRSIWTRKNFGRFTMQELLSRFLQAFDEKSKD